MGRLVEIELQQTNRWWLRAAKFAAIPLIMLGLTDATAAGRWLARYGVKRRITPKRGA
jgi:hypothetical protein